VVGTKLGTVLLSEEALSCPAAELVRTRTPSGAHASIFYFFVFGAIRPDPSTRRNFTGYPNLPGADEYADHFFCENPLISSNKAASGFFVASDFSFASSSEAMLTLASFRARLYARLRAFSGGAAISGCTPTLK
jgi:hypothetical protein